MSKIIEVHCVKNELDRAITIDFCPPDKYWICENKENLAIELQEEASNYLYRPFTQEFIGSLELSLQDIIDKWIYYGKIYVSY